MNKKHEFFSDAHDGNLQKSVRVSISKILRENEGKRFRITLALFRNTRSLRQNRYYFGVVVAQQQACFLERWGEVWDKNEVHDWNKANIFCKELVNEATGEIIRKPQSSIRTISEFEERMEKLRQKFELDFEWRIPLPHEILE